METVATRKEAIELLAFLSMVKNAHSNSILYKSAACKMAAKVGMSDGRILNKYLTKCLDMGLCTEELQSYNTSNHRTAYKFIAYSNALQLLLNIKGAELKYFPLHKSAGKFKAYQYRIERDLFATKLAQQAYRSNSNFPNKQNVRNEIYKISKQPVSKRTTGEKRRLSKLLKQLSEADTQAAISKAKGHVNGAVTGCFDLAKTIGKSSTTAFKRFLTWADEGKIELHDVVHFTPSRSKQEADLIIEAFKQQKVRGVHVYSSKEKGIKTIMGKKVIGFTSAKYSYGTLCNDSSSLTFSKSPKNLNEYYLRKQHWQ